jgi:D-alanyl-D-alanine carboxypeptidase
MILVKRILCTCHIFSYSLTLSLLVICLLALVYSASVPAAAASTGKPPAFVAKLKPLLEAQMKDLEVPGALIDIDMPGQGSWTTALGTSSLATGEPMNVNSYMRVGSITKSFVATAILQYMEQGKIHLADPVSMYLSGVPNGDNITLHEVLNMTSGLFNYSEDQGLIQQILANPQRVWTPQELLAVAFQHQPNFPPGEGWHYSNTNYILLGLILEKLSGLPVEKVIQQRIFRPLGLFDTSLSSRNSAAIPDPHPQGYTLVTPTDPFLNATDWNPSWGWAAGSAISTLHDLKIWIRALATGTLLHPATQKERLEEIQSVGYGQGIEDLGGGLIGHEGNIFGFQSFMGYQPEKSATVIVLANLNMARNGSQPADALAGIIQQELLGSPTPASTFSDGSIEQNNNYLS